MRTTFLKKKAKSLDMPLQITSMADIFMILLVFLLKSYSTSISNFAPTGDTRLPIAVASDTITDALKIEVTRNAILLDQKMILALSNFQFFPGQKPGEGTPGPLYKVLFFQRQKMPDPNREPNLVVMADERTPYSTLQGVLASAANAGFVDLQLVVVQEE
jgi:biopolymer transport protein ExbD